MVGCKKLDQLDQQINLRVLSAVKTQKSLLLLLIYLMQNHKDKKIVVNYFQTDAVKNEHNNDLLMPMALLVLSLTVLTKLAVKLYEMWTNTL